MLDTRLGATAAFQADRGAAKERIARLETVANSQPLPVAHRRAPRNSCGRAAGSQGAVHLHRSLPRRPGPSEQAARLQQQLGRVGRSGHLRDRRGRRQPDRLRPGRSAALGRSALEPQHAGRGDRRFPAIGAAGQRDRRTAPARCRSQAAETRASRPATPRRASCGRSSFASAGSSRARTRASCGSSARTAWRPTTRDTSRSR